jgi:hypothetical protein
VSRGNSSSLPATTTTTTTTYMNASSLCLLFFSFDADASGFPLHTRHLFFSSRLVSSRLVSAWFFTTNCGAVAFFSSFSFPPFQLLSRFASLFVCACERERERDTHTHTHTLIRKSRIVVRGGESSGVSGVSLVRELDFIVSHQGCLQGTSTYKRVRACFRWRADCCKNRL